MSVLDHPTASKPTSWVLDHSPSIFVPVIREREESGSSPCPMSTVHYLPGITLAEVRWPDDVFGVIFLKVAA